MVLGENNQEESGVDFDEWGGGVFFLVMVRFGLGVWADVVGWEFVKIGEVQVLLGVFVL